MFYLLAGRDYVDISHGEEQGDPLDWLIRGRALSRKISGGHRNDMSSVSVPDVAVVSTAPACEMESATTNPETVPGKGRTRRRTAGADVGQLLRGAYRQTVEEAIPDDLLDLLNRLE